MNKISGFSALRVDKIIITVGIVIARVGLAYLFFTQLWWKLPPTFGCTNNYAFPKPAAQGFYDDTGTSGLCYYMGLESIFASRTRYVLVADMHYAGLPDIKIDIMPIARLNGLLLDNVFIPNIRVTGWLVWLAEFWIFLSMLLGFLSRLGGLVSVGMSLQLYIGLANIPRPFEWEWSYGAIVLLSMAMFGVAAGRYAGVDAWLRNKLSGPADRGSLFARIILFLT